MNIPLNEVIFFDCITTHPSTGAATDADSTPTFAVYEESTDTDIGIGGNLTKRTSLTGNYRGTFTLSAANGFEVGKWYSIIGSATVNAIAGKAVLKNFRLVAAETTAGSADIDAAAVRAAVGLASANLDTQLDALPTNAELATALGTADDAVLAAINDLPTNAELATALGTADDAVLAAINDLPTNAELATALGTADDAVLAAVALVKAKTDSLTFTVAGQVDANIESVNGTQVIGNGETGSEWGPV